MSLPTSEVNKMAGTVTHNVITDLAEVLRSNKVGLFSERDTTQTALDYAMSMFPKNQQAHVMTAVMVYHNTLLEMLAKQLESVCTKLK